MAPLGEHESASLREQVFLVRAATARSNFAANAVRAAIEAPRIAATIDQRRGGGEPLAGPARHELERDFDRDLSAVRIHRDADAGALARDLGANAFVSGADVFFNANRYDPEGPAGRYLLRHEIAHVVQQTDPPAPGGGGAPRVAPIAIQCDSDPLAPDLAASAVDTWSDAELTTGERALLTALADATTTRPALEHNLALVQHAMAAKGLPVQPYWGMRLATTDTDKASPAQVASLETRIDVLLAIVGLEFPAHAATIQKRLQDERAQLPNLHRDDVLREGDRLEAMQTAIEAIARTKRSLPAAAPEGLEDPWRAVTRAADVAIDNLGTLLQQARIDELEASTDAYIDAYTALILQRASELLQKLKDAPDSFDESNGFINGWAQGNVIYLSSTLAQVGDYISDRNATIADLEKLGDLGAVRSMPLADRLAFLEKNGTALTDYMRCGQALLLMSAGFFAGMQLMQAVTQETDWATGDDIATAELIRRDVIVALDNHLAAPTDDVIAAAAGALHAAAGQVDWRVNNIRTFEHRFGIALEIVAAVASMYGGMAAMEAAGGSGIAASGAVDIAQFVRGGLAFSMASQMITSGLTGTPITPSSFVYQTSMDLATMGLMHGVGEGLSSLYGSAAKVPVGVMMTAQFTALWGWSAGMSLLQMVTSGKLPSRGKVVDTVVGAEQETALGMLMMGAAERIGQLPLVPEPDHVTAQQRAALAVLDDVRGRGKAIEAEISAWAESGQSPETLERLMGASESWYGSFRKAMNGLADAAVLTTAQADAINAQTANHVAELRNVRDMGRLGLRETGEMTVGYGGDVRNLDAFLGRLQRQQSIKSYEPVAGRAGIYKVTGADGRVTFYYPDRPAPSSGKGLDLGREALAESFPNVDPAIRAKAASALATLSPGDATRVALELGGPNGEAVLHWMAKLADAGVPHYLSGDLLVECAKDPALRARLESLDSKTLDTWHDAPFEQAMGGRGGGAFLSFLDEVRSRRGSIDVRSPGEAIAIVGEIASAQPMFTVQPPGPAMSAPGGPAPEPTTFDAVEQLRKTYSGEFKHVEIGGTTRILQIKDGAIARAWVWTKGTISAPVEVASTVASLNKGIKAADAMPDAARRDATIESLKPAAEAIEFLREIRGASVDDGLGALDRILPRAIVEPPQPAPAPTPEPAPENVPVTTRDLIISRHTALLDRARNMGRLDDPVVAVLTSWSPGSKRSGKAPIDPIAALDAVQTYLDQLRDATLRTVTTRIGAGNMAKLKAEAFGGRADFADFLVQLRGKQNISLEALRGLGYMTQIPPEGEPPIAVEKVFELARTAAERNMVLEQFGRLIDRKEGPVPGAYRMLADMTASPNAWRGGAWTLRAIEHGTERGIFKLEDIEGFEETETTTIQVNDVDVDLVRRYDVKLTSGEKLEMKSWTRWFPDKIRSQFRRDALIQTNQFNDLRGFQVLRWVFEGPPGTTEMTPKGPRFQRMTEAGAKAQIQKAMEAGLEDAMNDLGIHDEKQRGAILKAFREQVNRIIVVDDLRGGV